MPNRGFATHDKEGRRLRLWLKPETWKLLEQREAEKWPYSDDNSIVEHILERWAEFELNRASKAPGGELNRAGRAGAEAAS